MAAFYMPPKNITVSRVMNIRDRDMNNFYLDGSLGGYNPRQSIRETDCL